MSKRSTTGATRSYSLRLLFRYTDRTPDSTPHAVMGHPQ